MSKVLIEAPARQVHWMEPRDRGLDDDPGRPIHGETTLSLELRGRCVPLRYPGAGTTIRDLVEAVGASD